MTPHPPSDFVRAAMKGAIRDEAPIGSDLFDYCDRDGLLYAAHLMRKKAVASNRRAETSDALFTLANAINLYLGKVCVHCGRTFDRDPLHLDCPDTPKSTPPPRPHRRRPRHGSHRLRPGACGVSAAETLFDTDAAVDSLAVVQIGVIKALVDRLTELDLSPQHLRIDTKRVSDTRPDISLWMQTRTDFEALCSALKVKPHERRYSQPGQREWYADHDNAERRLLIQVVSFKHHDDWQERGQ